MSSLIRLQKFISDSGVCSRRNAEVLIVEKRVTVNGQIVDKLGSKVDIKKDAVKLDGKRLHLPKVKNLVVYALNKPKGCVSTLFDPENRATIARYIPINVPRLIPVGRLDYDTEGLILLTNDGQLANKIMHPRYQIWKYYLVKVKGELNNDDIISIRSGFKLRGKFTAPARIKKIKTLDEKNWYEIQLREGRNHQLKKLFLDFGISILKIKRFKIGNIELGDIKKGECRKLNKEQLQSLYKLLQQQTDRVNSKN